MPQLFYPFSTFSWVPLISHRSGLVIRLGPMNGTRACETYWYAWTTNAPICSCVNTRYRKVFTKWHPVKTFTKLVSIFPIRKYLNVFGMRYSDDLHNNRVLSVWQISLTHFSPLLVFIVFKNMLHNSSPHINLSSFLMLCQLLPFPFYYRICYQSAQLDRAQHSGWKI